MADVPVVMAVFLQYVEGSRTVGVAYSDATGRKLGACQFTDDEHFCNLETVLVQLGAKECVLPKVRASCCNLPVCLKPPQLHKLSRPLLTKWCANSKCKLAGLQSQCASAV